MKRTSIFLTDDLERRLRETAKRTRRAQAEIVRDALTQYFQVERRPWPRSIGMAAVDDPEITSENVKDWIREHWHEELEGEDPSEC